MGHKLVIDVPREVYQRLNNKAKQSNQTAEELAVHWLETLAQRLREDPVEKFIGAFKSKVSDWADQHDHYLGVKLMNDLTPEDYET